MNNVLNNVCVEVMTKLHEGELVNLLRQKGRYKWKELAALRSVTERTAMRWGELEELEPALKTELAEFFGIDVRAFVNSDVREHVLKNFRSKHSTIRTQESNVPVKIDQLAQKINEMEKSQRAMEELQKQILRLLKENQKRG